MKVLNSILSLLFALSVSQVKSPDTAGVFIPVSMYHMVVSNNMKENDYTVRASTFENDVKYLKNEGYESVFPFEVYNYAEYGDPLPEKPVIISLDDGHCGAVHYVLPILEKYDFCAVINIEGEFSEKSTKEGDHDPRYSYLTWDEIIQLADSERFEIGNHTYSMHSLTGTRQGCRIQSSESAEHYRLALNKDIGKLQDILKNRCGYAPVTFAYPYGFVSNESIPILAEMGFNVLFTCHAKPNYVKQGAGTPLVLNRLNRPGNTATAAYMRALLG